MENDLAELVVNLQEQYRTNANDIRSWDEEKTKLGMILPILQKLSWDVFDMNEVHPEYNLDGKKVDFSLRLANSNLVFLEAKRVDEDLEIGKIKSEQATRAARAALLDPVHFVRSAAAKALELERIEK